MSETRKIIRQAISDPGSVLPRDHGNESVSNWSSRAVLTTVADLLTDDDNVEEIMEMAQNKHPWLDVDDAAKMFDVIADWLRSRS